VATTALDDRIMIFGFVIPSNGATGTEGTGTEVWSTNDGTSWYRAFLIPPVNGGPTAGTSANGALVLAGVLVTTSCCTVPALWTDVEAPGYASDGAPQVLEFEGDPPGEFSINSVGALGTTIVAVGLLEFVTADCTGCVREGVVVTATFSP
jgi:hypothetical protein